MLQDLALAIRLQSVDHKLAGLQREIATLPKNIAEIEITLQSHRRKLEGDRAEVAANQRDRKRLEGEIQTHDAKISKLKGQMLDAKTNEQYRAFQNEISYCETEIRKAEDQILDLMERAEPLEKNVKAAERALQEEEKRVEAEKKVARERTAVDQRELEQLQAERATIVAAMDKKLYTEYERIRKKTRGTVIAEATDGRCDGCRIVLRPQFFQDLRRGDKIMFCESCGRILTYNPLITFENEIARASHGQTA